jgi:hypothetical protein
MPRGNKKSPEELRREADQIEHEHGAPGEKNPSRVAGGKRAAATRKEKYGSASPGAARSKRDSHPEGG